MTPLTRIVSGAVVAAEAAIEPRRKWRRSISTPDYIVLFNWQRLRLKARKAVSL
jgi:hypothetical protein